MLNRLLIQIGALAILLGVIGVLWLSGNTARAERDLAEQNYQLAAQVNRSNVDTIRDLSYRIETQTEAYKTMLQNYRDAERKATESLQGYQQAIRELREINEEINAYLAIHVPDGLAERVRDGFAGRRGDGDSLHPASGTPD